MTKSIGILALLLASLWAAPQSIAREMCIDIYVPFINPTSGNAQCFHIWICDGAGGDGWAYTDQGLC